MALASGDSFAAQALAASVSARAAAGARAMTSRASVVKALWNGNFLWFMDVASTGAEARVIDTLRLQETLGVKAGTFAAWVCGLLLRFGDDQR